MHDPSRTAVIVFNGEIYNFRELRADLERSGHSFRGHSDTEVLLALYEAKGEAMLSLLNGIFAFAIWDDAARSLFLACDAMARQTLVLRPDRRGVPVRERAEGADVHRDDPRNTRRRVALSHAGIPLESWRSDADPRCSAARSRRSSPRQGLPHRPPVDLGAFDVACGTDRRWRGRSGTACRAIAADRRPSPDGGRRAGWRVLVRWRRFECGGRHGPRRGAARLIASRSTREACAIAAWWMTCRMHDRLRATSV